MTLLLLLLVQEANANPFPELPEGRPMSARGWYHIV